ncbi:hypothetical protein [Halorientalis pallida]|uniref:Uncharacterized protein n=1 Tax=Halorientalis pallida TaxID=2479928 RepID=A0A498KZT6_9EURY|nr:hypothetical protein [Halorientalis pallida]RXK51550.1 hypothetical protein EAF64_02675 [Halorientalis pallida]
MTRLDAVRSRLVRNPTLAASAFAVVTALFALLALSSPASGPSVAEFVPFVLALGIAVGVIAFVGLSALSR